MRKGVIMDLIIRNAKLRDRHERVDIGIHNGTFHTIAETIKKTGIQEIDAQGRLVTPPFVESHVHLDSALTVGNPTFNQSGTLLEGIDIWSTYKQTLTKESIKKHAQKAIDWLITQGVLRIRTHTDSTEPNLLTLEAILELKEEMKDFIDIQVVAFPQDGIFAHAGMDERLIDAIKMGADVIGGMPQVELTREDGIESIAYIFNLAEKYHKLIDIHTDETGDAQSRFSEVIAKYTLKYSMANRVTASHTTAMHNYHNDYAAKLIGNLKRAGVHIVTNPFSNTLLQNRLDGYPRGRGHTRVDELLQAGVNISIGNDNIMDPFNPYGKGSMLHAANLLAHTAHLSGHDQVNHLFDMITVNGAKIIQDHNYGIEEGQQADCIMLDASHEQEAIRLTSECLYVIRKGEIIAETKPATRTLHAHRDSIQIDFKH